MSKLVVLLVVVLSLASANVVKSPRIYEQKIKNAIQKIMTNLRENGVPSLNVSSLDPLVYPRFELKYNNQSLADVSLNLTDVLVNGMTRVEIPNIKFNVIGFHFTYELVWPLVEGKCNYELLANVYLQPMDPVWGDGPFNFTASNFKLSGEGKLSLVGLTHLHLDSFTVGLSLGDLDVQVGGVYHDTEFSHMVSLALSAAGPNLLDEFHQEITDFVSPLVRDKANEILKNVTIGEIIGYYGLVEHPMAKIH